MAKTLSATLCLLLIAVGAALASIEQPPPVRVTHKNSGPSYYLGNSNQANPADKADVTSSKLAEAAPSPSDFASLLASSLQAVSQQGETNNNNKADSDDDDDSKPVVGHIMIRRIFLVPIEPAQPKESLGEPSGEPTVPLWAQRQQKPPVAAESGESPSVGSLLHSILASRRHHELTPGYPHLFGRDDASRSPSQPSDATALANKPKDLETEASLGQRQEAIDGLRMIVNMMQQLADSMPSEGPQQAPNKTTSKSSDEIVDIEGKQFSRKVIVDKHVGNNMVLVARRIVLVPLNETEPATGDGTTAAPQESSTVTIRAKLAPLWKSASPDREESTTTTPTTTAEATTKVAPEQKHSEKANSTTTQ